MKQSLIKTSTRHKNADESNITGLIRDLKSDWQDWEASLLVENGLKQNIVDVYFPETGERLQSFIYGFDLSRSELLLDGFYPFPDWILNRLHSGSPPEFWLQIKASEAFFNILVALSEIEGDFLTVQVLEAGLTRNRRWEDRVHFPSRFGPKAEVLLPDKPVQEAQLSNLSLGGAQIIIFGSDAKSLLRNQRHINCRIKFNQDFIFDLYSEIKQCQFNRTPCCHSILRLEFKRLNPNERAQLSSLIAAFHPSRKENAA